MCEITLQDRIDEVIRNAPESLGVVDTVEDLGSKIVAFFEHGRMDVNKKTLASKVVFD